VVDAANVIPDDQERALVQKLEQLQQRTKNQLVVVTVPSLEDRPVEDYANALFRRWGVGLLDANNGALLLVAPGERKVRVEVGYGLEPVVTDAFSSGVIQDAILPRFRAGDLPGGVEAGVDRLVQQLSLPEQEARARADAAAQAFDRTHRRRTGGGGGGVPAGAIFWLVVFLVVILPLLRRSAGRGTRYRAQSDGGMGSVILWSIANEMARNATSSRHGGSGWGGIGSSGGGGGWSGGWTDGGFSGGGGGSSGGGGASGDW
jgi:uncharacterized protein